MWLGHVIRVSHILGVRLLAENRRLVHTLHGVLDELLLIQHVDDLSMLGVCSLGDVLSRFGYCVLLRRDRSRVHLGSLAVLDSPDLRVMLGGEA